MFDSGNSCALEADTTPLAVCLTAKTAENRVELQLAADVYRAVDHPGVVRFLSVDNDTTTTYLRTQFAGGRTLETAPPHTAAVLAGLAAATAQILSDLHEQGISHGSVVASHVLLASSGRPVLCGLGRGKLRARVDEVRWRNAVRSDRDGLLALVDQSTEQLIAVSSFPLRVRPQELVTRYRLNRVLTRMAHRDLDISSLAAAFAAVASTHVAPQHFATDNALPTVATSQPGKGVLGRDHTTNPSDALPHRGVTAEWPKRWKLPRFTLTHRPVSRLTTPRNFALLLFITGIVLTAAGLVSLLDRAPTKPSPVHSQSAASPGSCPQRQPAVSPQINSADTWLDVDIDHDGCSERVRLHGTTLTVNGASYTLGKPGDLIRFGDWDGDGIATPAVIRPKSGSIFVFQSWPSLRRRLSTHATTRVVGVRSVHVRSTTTGRDVLVVEPRSGPAIEVPHPTRTSESPHT